MKDPRMTDSTNILCLPSSTSKKQEIQTGRWGRNAGTGIQNQGGKHARNFNAKAEEMVVRTDERLRVWHGKKARQRQLKKLSMKDKRPVRVGSSKALTGHPRKK